MAGFKAQFFGTATSSSPNLTTLLAELPKMTWYDEHDLYLWEGFWYFPTYVEGAIAVRSHFQASDTDVIIASGLKTGTTWTKALVASIMSCRQESNGDAYVVDDDEDPLITDNPHALVKTLEGFIYTQNRAPDLSGIPSPRIFHTHMPYQALPESIKNSNCKMVYVVRNPKDTFVSMWHFYNKITRTLEQGPFPMEKAFDSFCNGVHPHGPFFDHVLEYWKESLKRPQKILFLKYEEMKRDPREQVKLLASFLGRPFAKDEEADKVLWRCSLERMKNLNLNKIDVQPYSVVLANSSFFRLGIVGDWKNNFTPEMTERLDQITRLKLEGSGLDLEI